MTAQAINDVDEVRLALAYGASAIRTMLRAANEDYRLHTGELALEWHEQNRQAVRALWQLEQKLEVKR